jgi:hypothetical protein
MAKELFSEEQQFNQIIIWILVGIGTIPMMAILGWGIYQQLILGQPWGNEPMSDLGLLMVTLLCIVIMLGVVLLLRFLKLETKVDRWGVHYRFSPLINQWKEINKVDIHEFQLKQYSFRGYGIRWGLDGIKTLNVKGNKGIEFHYGENKRLIIGSQQPEMFLAALEKMMNPEIE